MVYGFGGGTMREPLAYGIDFGTSNSSIAVTSRRKAEVLGDLTDPGIASLLYLDALGLSLTGDVAAQQYLTMVDKTQTRLMSSLKSVLTDDFNTTSSWGTEWTLEDLTHYFFRDLKKAADDRVGAKIKKVVIGNPVVFVGAEGENFQARQSLALKRLNSAAKKAGFTQIAFLDEPTAALRHNDLSAGINVALDFGGGTFDVSVIHYRSRRTEVLSTHGVEIGGDIFDGAVFDLALHKRLGFNDLRYGDSIGDSRTTAGMLHLIGRDTNALNRLHMYVQSNNRSGLRILERVINSGQAYSLSKAVESAKIELSTKSTAMVELVRPDAGISIRQEVKRSDFVRKIADDLDQISKVIAHTLKKADITADNVDQVILTGGSCQIPAFKRRVASKFHSSKISDASVASRVSLGLAAEARRIWA
jgi:hypothetical chaperone protein